MAKRKIRLTTLHFVNVKVGRRTITVSQHKKKSIALKRLKTLRKKGFKGRVISQKARWTY